MTTCLILAAGDAERHNGGNKPLLKVNGETLLGRLRRQLDYSEKGTEIWLATHRSDLDGFGIQVIVPKARRWIVETLLSLRDFWSKCGKTIVLLADVYYTDRAIQTLLYDAKEGAFGCGCNIHALVLEHTSSEDIAQRLARSVEFAHEHPRAHGAGKLWLFVECWGATTYDFGDETTDFDSPQEHQRFIAKYGNRNR